MRFEVTTRASPEQVRQALTDFTDRRLDIWSDSLDPRTYEVRELGDSWAVARESTAGSPFWLVSAVDGGGLQLGWVSYGIGPDLTHGWRWQPGACRVDLYRRSRIWERVVLTLIQRFPLRRIIARGWMKASDRYAQSGHAQPSRQPPNATRVRVLDARVVLGCGHE